MYEPFDHLLYSRLYPDVWYSGLRTAEATRVHWTTIGQHTGRICQKQQITQRLLQQCQFDAKRYTLTLGGTRTYSDVDAFYHWVTRRPLPASIPFPLRGILPKPDSTTPFVLGIVVTTYGSNSIYVLQCIASYYRCVAAAGTGKPHVILYINEVSDVDAQVYAAWFPSLEVVFVPDQTKNGGLTGTWNQGIDWCKSQGCTHVLLSNDDTMATPSIRHLITAARTYTSTRDALCYFGPVTNNPGPIELNRWQYATSPQTADPVASQSRVLNGFCMLFPLYVLEHNRFDNAHYFDPRKPFTGNEVEWGRRLLSNFPNAFSVVVPKAYVHHVKLAQWRDEPSAEATSTLCAYTINTGGYERDILLNGNTLPMPTFYLTDDDAMIYEAASRGLIPMHTEAFERLCPIPSPNPHQLQRFLKTVPERILPAQFTISLYVDGNCLPDAKGIQSVLDAHMLGTDVVDLVCWEHPTRTRVYDEAREVTKFHLETSKNVADMLHKLTTEYSFSEAVDNGLTETNVLLRRHCQSDVSRMHTAWSNAVAICRRDQISFDPLLRHFNVKYARLPNKEKPVQKRTHSGDTHLRTIST